MAGHCTKRSLIFVQRKSLDVIVTNTNGNCGAAIICGASVLGATSISPCHRPIGPEGPPSPGPPQAPPLHRRRRPLEPPAPHPRHCTAVGGPPMPRLSTAEAAAASGGCGQGRPSKSRRGKRWDGNGPLQCVDEFPQESFSEEYLQNNKITTIIR